MIGCTYIHTFVFIVYYTQYLGLHFDFAGLVLLILISLNNYKRLVLVLKIQ